MLIRDCIAIVSHTLPEAFEASKKGPMYSPTPETVFLVECETPWQLNEIVGEWITKDPEIDPWDVTVISCDFIWEPVEPYMCANPEIHDNDDFDDYYDEHRYCGTQGGDRLAHAAEIVGWNDDGLDPNDQHSATFMLSWIIAELIAAEDAYPGVDFFNIHFGLYPQWSASLHGGVMVKAS